MTTDPRKLAQIAREHADKLGGTIHYQPIIRELANALDAALDERDQCGINLNYANRLLARLQAENERLRVALRDIEEVCSCYGGIHKPGTSKCSSNLAHTALKENHGK